MPGGIKIISIDKYILIHYAACGYIYINNILCYSGGSPVGYIRFYPKGQVPASKVAELAPGWFRFFLNYEIDRYPEIIETLRYEKPVSAYVNWDEDNVVTYGYIGTDTEPIGEQEGSGVPQAS
jgi:hypothetical protein